MSKKESLSVRMDVADLFKKPDSRDYNLHPQVNVKNLIPEKQAVAEKKYDQPGRKNAMKWVV